MEQKDKELLLKDLCARLPYETKVYWENCNYGDKIKNVVSIDIFGMVNDEFLVEECKPYLRPMSSMTEKEWEEYEKTLEIEYQDMIPGFIYHKTLDSYYYLLEHHFDFRGLIDRGLAIEVTDDNNPYKRD